MTEKIKILLLFFIFIGVLSADLFGQEVPEKKRRPLPKKEVEEKGKKSSTADKDKTTKAEEDTTSDYPFAQRDTLVTQAIRSNLVWYDITNSMKTRRDTSQFLAFRFNEEKELIYTDMSDIFRNRSFWYDYDFRESGRPAYLSLTNKFPHQTGIFYNGIIMNEPTHGMFNSQYIPLNFIRNVQLDLTRGQLHNFGFTSGAQINIVSHSRHTKAAWSRILYKQGTFGYSDLDISFVKPISETFAVQLGGINKLYDGAILNGDHHGTNYRGEITWQYSPTLFLRAQFFLNRVRVGMTQYITNQEIVFPRHIDLRDDYTMDLTWLPDDSSTQRLHFVFYNTYSHLRFKDAFNTSYIIDSKFKKYGTDTNFNFNLGKNELLIGIGGIYQYVWGTGFTKTYYLHSANAYATLKIPISEKLNFSTGAQMAFSADFNPHLLPSANLEMVPFSGHHFSIAASRGIRLPNANERFFSFDTLFGNKYLVPEEHVSVSGKYMIGNEYEKYIAINSMYNFIDKEINWIEPNFINGGSRDYFSAAIEGGFNVWKFRISAGGQYTFADLNINPRSSVWGSAHFHDVWLHGAVIVDAYGTANFYDQHRKINFEPRLQRFYVGSGTTDEYFVLNWKIVATVQNARLFFEMDNSLGDVFEIINGYSEISQRWRFGVLWTLWD